MPTIPKFTVPQAKMIRTLEGILVVAFNLAMVIVPIVSSALPAATAVKYAAIVNTATVVARSLAKGIMGWQTPLLPAAEPVKAQLGEALVAPAVTLDQVEKLLNDHDAQISDAVAAQVPGAVRDVLSGLAGPAADHVRASADTTAARQAAAPPSPAAAPADPTASP